MKQLSKSLDLLSQFDNRPESTTKSPWRQSAHPFYNEFVAPPESIPGVGLNQFSPEYEIKMLKEKIAKMQHRQDEMQEDIRILVNSNDAMNTHVKVLTTQLDELQSRTTQRISKEMQQLTNFDSTVSPGEDQLTHPIPSQST